MLLRVCARISLRGTSHTTTSLWDGSASVSTFTALAPMNVLPPPVGTFTHTFGAPARSSL